MTECKKEIIAGLLAEHFNQFGFSDVGVDALASASNVSIRTLYKYFPSREEMIVGALEHRHKSYLRSLETQIPAGREQVLDIFTKTGVYILSNQSKGCLFLRALTCYPMSESIRSLVQGHKQAIRNLIQTRLELFIPEARIHSLRDQLFTLLEGQIFAALSASSTTTVTETTCETVQTLLEKEFIDDPQ